MPSERLRKLRIARSWSNLAFAQGGLTIVQLVLSRVDAQDFPEHSTWFVLGAIATGALMIYAIVQCRKASRESDNAGE